MHKQYRTTTHGFTIVELLIVIVVIGILAAIVIVAFNGIQDRARVTSAKSDLGSLGKLVSIKSTDDGYYPILGATYKQIIIDSKVPISGLSFGICASTEGYAIADYRKGSIANGETLYYVHSSNGVTSLAYNASTTGTTILERICRQIYPTYTNAWWYGNL